MIQYSGNAQTSIFSPTSKQDIINAVGAALIAAGWTTVSGGTGTTVWKLQSATTPQGYAIRVLMKDNGGNCVTFSLESSDGTLVGGNSTTVGAFLIPGGYTYQIVCCKYQCFVYAVPYTSASRTFVAFGVPYVPSWITSITNRVGWMEGMAQSDTDAGSSFGSLRNALCLANLNAPSGIQVLYNNALWTFNNISAFAGCPQLVLMWGNASNGQPGVYRWQNNAAMLYDALLSCGDSGANMEGKIKGMLWDACCSSDAYSADTSSTFDTHNWTTMAGSATSTQRGTLLLATS